MAEYHCELCELYPPDCQCPLGPWRDIDEGVKFLLGEHNELNVKLEKATAEIPTGIEMTEVVDALSAKIEDELSQHELRDPDYTPTEHEHFIANDFVQGLLVDHEFLRLVWQHYNEIIVGRIEAGDCVDCGCPNGDHWGGCGTSAPRRQR
jgi:hypothetical protein